MTIAMTALSAFTLGVVAGLVLAALFGANGERRHDEDWPL